MATGEFRSCDTADHAQLTGSLRDGFGVQLMIENPALTVTSARAANWEVAIAPLGLDVALPQDAR